MIRPAQESLGKPPYRADIDGLRALAVIAVLLFHAEIPGFKGGYVGVDVFFVISGYLITQLLISSPARSGGEMLGTFYVRRARRILPALLLTCALTACAAFVLLVPAELVFLGKQLAAAPMFLSNLAVWSDHVGYFDQGTAYPGELRHLWSVAVEEQFYLLYPLLLLIITHYLPRRGAVTLALLAVLSLLMCVWASYYHASANYFALPTRAWELLMGAVLALTAAVRFRARLANELLAAVSLLLLILTIYAYDPDRISYPGTYTLLPCLATAALISTGRREGTFVNRLLAWRPLVFVGLISYSLYLLHRPLLAFVSYYSIRPLAAPVRLCVLLATVVLALLSWRFIEQPVRTRKLLKSTRSLVIAATTASALVLAAGLLLWRSSGFPGRFTPSERNLIALAPNEGPIKPCLSPTPEQVRTASVCEFGDRGGSGGRALLWGDSHALALLPAYDEIAAARHIQLYFVMQPGCWPLLGTVNSAREDPQERAECAAFNSNVVQGISRLDPATIILAGRWNDAQFMPAAGPRSPANISAFSSGMQQTLAAIGAGSRRTVCLLLDVPSLKYPGSHTLLMAQRRNLSDELLRLTRAQAIAPVRNMEQNARALAQAGELRVVDPKDLLCPGEECLYKDQGHSLYFDDDHLSSYGARYVASALSSCFGAPLLTQGNHAF